MSRVRVRPAPGPSAPVLAYGLLLLSLAGCGLLWVVPASLPWLIGAWVIIGFLACLRGI